MGLNGSGWMAVAAARQLHGAGAPCSHNTCGRASVALVGKSKRSGRAVRPSNMHASTTSSEAWRPALRMVWVCLALQHHLVEQVAMARDGSRGGQLATVRQAGGRGNAAHFCSYMD